jgi:hypothetical protein
MRFAMNWPTPHILGLAKQLKTSVFLAFLTSRPILP